MCEFQEFNGNGFGDIWWTDKCIYFSSIDICPCKYKVCVRACVHDFSVCVCIFVCVFMCVHACVNMCVRVISLVGRPICAYKRANVFV